MLYPFEWQKLTNSWGKLFSREKLAARPWSDFRSPTTRTKTARKAGEGGGRRVGRRVGRMYRSHSRKAWGRLPVSRHLQAPGYRAELFVVVSLINIYFYLLSMFLGWVCSFTYSVCPYNVQTTNWILDSRSENGHNPRPRGAFCE